jgi:hypothetical protein
MNNDKNLITEFLPAKINDTILEYQSWINQEGNILLLEFSGIYPKGSEGNYHGSFMYATMQYYYAFYEPFAIVLDITNLKYTWGNTILKALSFFQYLGDDGADRQVLVVVSPQNRQAIESVLSFARAKNQCLIFEDKVQALEKAQSDFEHFLEI